MEYFDYLSLVVLVKEIRSLGGISLVEAVDIAKHAIAEGWVTCGRNYSGDK